MTKINPRLLQDLLAFDEQVWMVFCGIPFPGTLPKNLALRRYQRALITYLRLPKSEREDSSSMSFDIERCLESGGMPFDDQVKTLSILFWACVHFTLS